MSINVCAWTLCADTLPLCEEWCIALHYAICIISCIKFQNDTKMELSKNDYSSCICGDLKYDKVHQVITCQNGIFEVMFNAMLLRNVAKTSDFHIY